jgi:oligopeptidase A
MNRFPDWGALTPDTAAAELPRLLAEAETAVAALEEKEPATYEDLVWGLDDATRAVTRAWGRVHHLLSVMNDEAWRRLVETFQPKMVAFSLRVSQSRRLYELARRVRAVTTDPVRLRILERMIQDAELAGVGLDGATRARFNGLQERLARLSVDFSNAVIDATAAFSFEKNGVVYTIDDAHYIETMRACPDREVRERLLRARAMRAPENAARIDEILSLRRACAEILGFGTYADLSLATKCAPSVAAVRRMIDDLDAATQTIAAGESAELAGVQAPGGPVAGEPVRPWDVAYLAERLRESRYAYSEEDLKVHFEFETVLRGLFRLTNLLFGVDVDELPPAAKPSVWHPDVRVFAVKEDGRTTAHFYLDAYVRPGLKQNGAWMNDFSNRCARTDSLPLALMVLNIKAPDADGRTLLTMREVETLFHEFGHALQCMLTRIDEEDAAGINLVEWDAVEVASQFMENWCLDDRTGITVPSELKEKVKAARNFRAGVACRRQLALAKTDLLLHTAPPADPTAVMRETFTHFGVPMVDDDRFLCAFTHIFGGGYAAGYYSYKWSEVMSADCFGAFEEAGLADEAAVRRLGAAFRETVLGLGGSRNARDVFRAFRGRDPEIAALLRQQGLS